ncbi:MAG: carboxypeptidase regulatory-like domain-containing protein [Cyclobacteriaceae bacterium]
MKQISSILLGLLLFSSAEAQLTGVITDVSNKKPARNATVFINNTTLHHTTNSDGAFEINDLQPGFYDLVVYHPKYQIFKSSLQVQSNKAYQLNLSITPLEEKPKSTKKEEEWELNLEWFKNGLLGSDVNTTACKIVNEKALSFQRDGDQLTATATEPIIIENNALGYKITYYLQSFKASPSTADIQGMTQYEELVSQDYLINNEWNRNRQKAYWGSSRHLFQSMVQGHLSREGFKLYDENGKSIVRDTLVSQGKISGYYHIELPDITKVIYTIAAGADGDLKNETGKVSTLTKNGSVDVTAEGVLLNNNSVTIEGAMSHRGLAFIAPINYSSETGIESEKLDWQNFSLLREKVYLHTDRDYYYPRETIWFKAYMGYSMPLLRDTLSRLLYVEMVSPEGEILSTKNIRIRNGFGWGEFVVPPALAPGEYYLRAYTNWMRNYGEDLYTKPVPILSYDQNVSVAESEASETGNIKVIPDKTTYQTREKIALTISLEDKALLPANFSVSITDAEATLPLPQLERITTPGLLEVKLGEAKNEYFDNIEHFMERGLSFRGQVVDNKGTPSPAQVDIVQGNMDNLISMETDLQGNFLVTGLDFMDSLNFAFKSSNAKGKAFGKVELLAKDVPAFNYSNPKINLDFKSEDALQRVQNTYELDMNTILLNEVVIEDKSLKEEEKLAAKVYGTPDYVVKGKDMAGTTAGMNPLIGLQGRVPGLQVTEYLDEFNIRRVRVRIRGGTSSISGNTDPLILVDGVPWDVEGLMGLPPSAIDYIEVITRGVSMFGTRGANGVIAIYTKKGPDDADARTDYISYKVGGYTRPRPFSQPDYSEKNASNRADFRTTIFWSPNITLSANHPTVVECYAADVPTRYRIVVEGMNAEGKPFRGVSFVTITR